MGTDLAKVVAYYDSGVENDRLASGIGRLEFTRSVDLLMRLLPPPPARVLDVGGGPGRYASWMAQQGYEVTLVDPVPLHIEQARARATEHPFLAELGDARSLGFPDEAFDAVLLFGPLYHLMEAEERQTALREALRVVRRRGVVVAAVISRFSALLDGIRDSWFRDAAHLAKIVASLPAGALPDAIGTAYLHRPDQARSEAERAGLDDVQVVAVEGPFWLLSDLDTRSSDWEQWNLMLAAIRAIESEPLTFGATNHLLVTGTKP